jgi:hypothetical protein
MFNGTADAPPMHRIAAPPCADGHPMDGDESHENHT